MDYCSEYNKSYKALIEDICIAFTCVDNFFVIKGFLMCSSAFNKNNIMFNKLHTYSRRQKKVYVP